MATETVKIVITSTGAVTVVKEFNEIGAAAKNASTGVDFMRSALAGLMAYISVDTFISYADAATRVGNQLKMAGLEGEAFAVTQQKLYEAAIRNGQVTEELATIYQKMMSVQENLGYNSQQASDLTVNIATAMRMASSSTQAQSGALQQLSQLMGGTKVQAQEFNSLVDGAYPLLMAAAAGSERWGGSVAKLREDVKNSDVTVREFMEALRVGLPQVAEKASSMTLTIGQAFVGLGQAFQQYLATSRQAMTASGMLSDGLQWLAKNIELVIPAVVALGAAMAAHFGAQLLMSVYANIVQLTTGVARFGAMLVTTVVPAIVSAGVAVATMGASFLTALPGIVASTAAFVAANASMIALIATLALVAAGVAYLLDLLFNGGKAWASFSEAATGAVQTVKDAFDQLGEWTSNGLDVTVQGEMAAQKILEAFKGGGTDAANKVAQAVKTSATPAATALQNGVVQGGNQAAATQLTTAQQASQIGAATLANSFGQGATQVADAGKEGAGAMAAAIEAQGNIMAAKFEGTGRNIYDLWNNWGNEFINSFGTTIGDLLVQFQQAQTEQLKAQAELMRAQAALTREQYEILDRTGQMPGTAGQGGTGGNSGGPRTTTSTLGGLGGGMTGLSGQSGGNDFRAKNRGNGGGNVGRVNVDTGSNAGTSGGIGSKQAAAKSASGNTVNVFDAKGMIDALGSKAGKDAQINMVRANAAEIASILGVA